MNPDPPAEFDPSEELTHFARPRARTLRPARADSSSTCRDLPGHRGLRRASIHASIPSSARRGLPRRLLGRVHRPPARFWIDTRTRSAVKLWTASADDADGLRNRYLVHDGDASDPKAWEGLLNDDRQSREVRGLYQPRRSTAPHVDASGSSSRSAGTTRLV